MLIIKPSKIQGVGVFTSEDIKKGKKIPLFYSTDYKFRKSVSKEEKVYCIRYKKGYAGPYDFNRMSIGWYLNHSRTPNVKTRTWKAIRDIGKGEELFIDYGGL